MSYSSIHLYSSSYNCIARTCMGRYSPVNIFLMCEVHAGVWNECWKPTFRLLVLLTALTTTYHHLWSQAKKDIGTISSRKILYINEPTAAAIVCLGTCYLDWDIGFSVEGCLLSTTIFQEFKKEVSSNPWALRRLHTACKRAKCTLSAATSIESMALSSLSRNFPVTLRSTRQTSTRSSLLALVWWAVDGSTHIPWIVKLVTSSMARSPTRASTTTRPLLTVLLSRPLFSLGTHQTRLEISSSVSHPSYSLSRLLVVS